MKRPFAPPQNTLRLDARFSPDEYIKGRTLLDGKYRLVWPSELGPREVLMQFGSVLGTSVNRGTGYVPGSSDRAARIVELVRTRSPESIGIFYLDNRRHAIGWWEPNTLLTSRPLAFAAVALKQPDVEVWNNLIARTAVGGLAVYKATLDEFAANMQVLRAS